MNGFFVTNELDKYDEAIKQGMAGVLCSDEKLAREIVKAMTAAKDRQNNSEIAERVDNLRELIHDLDEKFANLEGALDDIDEELDNLEIALADENGELDDGEGEYGLCGGCGWLDKDDDDDEGDICPRCGAYYYCECDEYEDEDEDEGDDDEDNYNDCWSCEGDCDCDSCDLRLPDKWWE